jgi:hypothetical protein
MSALMEMARQHAAGETEDSPTGTAPAVAGESQELVPFAEIDEPTGDDPPQVSVFVAWARVMRDVQGVGKKGLYNGGGTRYNFRGVDAMINAFGPACRKHGVIVVPIRVTSQHAPATSTKGSAMRETTAVVTWRVFGPDGSHFDGESEGESLDSSDKGTAKAQSVALRAFLIAAGLVPTDEKDPDGVVHERGERPAPKAQDYVDEILDPRTSLSRLAQIKQELLRHSIGMNMVSAEDRDQPIGPLLQRIGKEREEASKAPRAAVEEPWPDTAQPPASAEGGA